MTAGSSLSCGSEEGSRKILLYFRSAVKIFLNIADLFCFCFLVLIVIGLSVTYPINLEQ